MPNTHARMENHPFTLESMVGGTMRVPATYWGVPWAQETFPDTWQTETYLCTVKDHQRKVKGLAEGLWLLYEEDERIHLTTAEVVEILDRGTTVAFTPLNLVYSTLYISSNMLHIHFSLHIQTHPQAGIILYLHALRHSASWLGPPLALHLREQRTLQPSHQRRASVRLHPWERCPPNLGPRRPGLLGLVVILEGEGLSDALQLGRPLPQSTST